MKTLKIWILIIIIGLVCFCSFVKADVMDVKAGVGPGLQTLFSDQHNLGPGLSLFSELGLTETISVSLSAAFSIHATDEEKTELLSSLELGAIYAIDVIEVIPFAGIKMGWMASGLGVGLTIGMDYLWTDSFFTGFAVEAYELFESFSGLPKHASFFIRFGYRWIY